MEPEKHEEWIWVDESAFKEYHNNGELFYSLQEAIKQLGSVENFFNLIRTVI